MLKVSYHVWFNITLIQLISGLSPNFALLTGIEDVLKAIGPYLVV